MKTREVKTAKRQCNIIYTKVTSIFSLVAMRCYQKETIISCKYTHVSFSQIGLSVFDDVDGQTIVHNYPKSLKFRKKSFCVKKIKDK